MKHAILLGDSIRIGYQPYVQQELAGAAGVWGPEENGRTSTYTLTQLDSWAFSRPADVIHINCGLHDLRREFGAGTTATAIDVYRDNVERILTGLRERTNAVVIWATTTPVDQELHHRNKDFDRFETDISLFNTAALDVCLRHGVVVNDLFAFVEQAGRARYLTSDGVHFSPEGYALLGSAVARAIRQYL